MISFKGTLCTDKRSVKNVSIKNPTEREAAKG